MGKNNALDPPKSQKYGVPIYSAAWVPYNSIKLALESDVQEEDRNQSGDVISNDDESLSERIGSLDYYVAFAGGGGEGRSGIPNAVVLAHFDFASNSLSDQPVSKCGTGSDLPYRMAIHPGGEGLICSLPMDCRLFKWDFEKDSDTQKLTVKPSEEVLLPLKDIGQQLALAFNQDGSAFAAGGEDGNLSIFKWPSMEIILNEEGAHKSVKDLHFSPDGKYLVSLGGPCKVWDVASATVLKSLPKENDEVFISCRFSQSNGDQVLYVATVTGKGGCIVTWNTTSWTRMSAKLVVRDSISAFSVSADGMLLACGTTQGDVIIINSRNMGVRKIIKKAHLGFVTTLSFSHDSRAVASASMDSSAMVSRIEDEKKKGEFSLWIILLMVIVAAFAYFVMNGGMLVKTLYGSCKFSQLQ